MSEQQSPAEQALQQLRLRLHTLSEESNTLQEQQRRLEESEARLAELTESVSKGGQEELLALVLQNLSLQSQNLNLLRQRVVTIEGNTLNLLAAIGDIVQRLQKLEVSESN